MSYCDDLTTIPALLSGMDGNGTEKWVNVPGGIKLGRIPFHSGFSGVPVPGPRAGDTGSVEHPGTEGFSLGADIRIPENTDFSYYMITPEGALPVREAVFLFHGLNEKSWDKYLPWAAELCRTTGKGIILFPIAFHMNRAPGNWTDRRSMMRLSSDRKERFPSITESSFINAALSSRLHAEPGRFLVSGLQTYCDIDSLAGRIRRGEAPMFSPSCRFDVFGYSVGALLAELLLMDNPGGNFTDSRGFFFCGGSTLDLMNPVSRYIMDSGAREALFSLIGAELWGQGGPEGTGEPGYADGSKQGNAVFSPLGWIMERFQSLGRFMKSMMNRKASPELRDGRFSEIGPRIGAVGLAGDSVVPGYAVAETLGKFCQPGRIAVLDFPFPYSHEQPFPLQLPREGGGGSAEAGIGGPVRGEVDVWFGRMAGAAAEVLCGA